MIQQELFYINKDNLIELFIDQLKEREIFIEGIKKFDLINRDNFKYEKDFQDEVRKVANSINITKENTNNGISISSIKYLIEKNSFYFSLKKKPMKMSENI